MRDIKFDAYFKNANEIVSGKVLKELDSVFGNIWTKTVEEKCWIPLIHVTKDCLGKDIVNGSIIDSGHDEKDPFERYFVVIFTDDAAVYPYTYILKGKGSICHLTFYRDIKRVSHVLTNPELVPWFDGKKYFNITQ